MTFLSPVHKWCALPVCATFATISCKILNEEVGLKIPNLPTNTHSRNASSPLIQGRTSNLQGLPSGIKGEVPALTSDLERADSNGARTNCFQSTVQKPLYLAPPPPPPPHAPKLSKTTQFTYFTVVSPSTHVSFHKWPRWFARATTFFWKPV